MFILYYNPYLTIAAVLPAVYLLVQVYHLDRLEREPLGLLVRLVFGGIISTLLAVVTEELGSLLLDTYFESGTVLYRVLMYFVVVGLSEEGFKYLMLKKRTWNNPNFNCQFDGVVYAVFTSLGFALWENIKYVYSYGFATAVVRAVTAVPGHGAFGVFMGVFYGMAKRWDNSNYPGRSRTCRRLAVIVPMLLHGAYDFLATDEKLGFSWVFFGFVVLLFVFANRLLRRQAREDRFIGARFPYLW